MDLYAEYIHKSRYARYLPARGRREHYPETVERYLTFMRNHYGEAVEPYIDEMRQAMLRRSAFPSMRAFWAAGPALERNHLTAYNCSYLSIRTPRDFAELLFISMCGTGVGFSCQERYHVSLPDVPAKLTVGEPVIVEDSREGWQDAVLAIITALFQGVYRPPDVRKVRLKGAKLKTTGGTASGPEPLIALIDHLVEVFERRAGKRLRSYDIHSICTKTGQIVQVGGVRRAAEMSLSDVDDALMRHAKDYKTQDVPEHFYMSNNSACYDGWPGEEVFRREWDALVASGSGERGIFNLEAARAKSDKVGRRGELIEGTNPCQTIDGYVLTTQGHRRLSELMDAEDLKVVTPKGVFPASKAFRTARSKIVKLRFQNGFEMKVAEHHRFRDRSDKWVEAKGLRIGDHLGAWRSDVHANAKEDPAAFMEGVLAGWYWAEGSKSGRDGNGSLLCVGQGEFRSTDMLEELTGVQSKPHHQKPDTCRVLNGGVALTAKLESYGVDRSKESLDWLHAKCSQFKAGFISAIFTGDGSVRKEGLCELYTTRKNTADVIAAVIWEFGVYCGVATHNKACSYVAKDGKPRNNRHTYKVTVPSGGFRRFDFLPSDKRRVFDQVERREVYRNADYHRIVALEELPEEDVYSITVDSDRHEYVALGAVSHNCAEILLRDKGLCNLSEQVIRADMTEEEFFRDCRVNAIFGTLQSGLTHFPNVRDIWRRNAEEERLLGCSITGTMDKPEWFTPTKENAERLAKGAKIIAETNVEVAKAIGINKSVCRTTIKPSGTLSKLASCAAGMHSRFAKYYLSRATQGRHDPICQFMIEQGVPYEQSKRDPDQIYFTFPQKAPEGGQTVEHEDALTQLNRWKMLARHWAEHSVSATIYVRPDEWDIVRTWVEQHFDEITGLSFLPYCGPGPDAHVYEQAPLEVLTEEQYYELAAKMPESIDWGAFEERDDQTTGAQELACVGGACELV